MARRGPKPESAAVKLAKGNSGRRPIGSDPHPVVGDQHSAVAAPEWLKGEGRTIWDRLAPRLMSLKLLTVADADAFGRYCQNFSRWLRMQRRMDADGEIYEIETASGLVRRPDPAFIIADRLERQLQAAEDRFGLNPSERQRIFAARAAGTSTVHDLFGEVPEEPSRRGRKPAGVQRPSATAVGFLN